MTTAEYQRRANRRVRIPDDPGSLARLARRLVDGESWHDLAREYGTIAARMQAQVREAVQPYCLALVEAEQPTGNHRRHGTRAMYYVGRCRCEPCRYACVTYERSRTRRHRRGLVPYVDADPVRAHLAWLSEEGIGWQRASRLAGLHNSVVWKLIYGCPSRGMGPSRRVRRSTAEAILAVQPTLDVIADGAYIPGEATWALVNWLLDKGASKTWIATQIAGRPTRALQLGRERVSGANAKAVRRLVNDVVAGRVQVQGKQSRWHMQGAA